MYPHNHIDQLKQMAGNKEIAPLLNVLLALYGLLHIRKNENNVVFTHYREMAGLLHFGIPKIRKAVYLLKQHKLISLINLGPGLGTKINVL